ncbi:MAG: hypothetical protein ACPG52_00375 [Cognaticolwellia sp.]
MKNFIVISAALIWLVTVNFLFFSYTGIAAEIVTGEGISKFKFLYFFTVLLPPIMLIVYCKIKGILSF